MRKYFLLSAVALLVATNVSANYTLGASGNFMANAYIFQMDELDCQSMVLYAYMTDLSQGLTAAVDTNSNVTITNGGTGLIQGGAAECTISNKTFTSADNFAVPVDGVAFDYYPLEDDADSSPSNATISDFTFRISDDGKTVYIGGTYTFPADFGPGRYSTYVPILYTYE